MLLCLMFNQFLDILSLSRSVSLIVSRFLLPKDAEWQQRQPEQGNVNFTDMGTKLKKSVTQSCLVEHLVIIQAVKYKIQHFWNN